MKIGLIGNGAIAGFVQNALKQRPHSVDAILVRQARVADNPNIHVGSVQDFSEDLDLVIDCAGHAALAMHGPAVLARGIDLVTVSLGALADESVLQSLEAAAHTGNAKLHLASGAIGALDCLQAARVGHLENVTYVGRKPPTGWRDSPAEQKIDLAALKTGAKTHFEGTAREAALAYPKNANVAAAVALAGVGFDKTSVRLIADADVSANIHEIEAIGDFGSFTFRINGQSLPDNPRSSALAAMSVISKLDRLNGVMSL